MANLITEKQKKEIKIDYYMRLFSVFLFVPSSLLGAFLLAYVIPYYLSVNEKDFLTAEQFTSVIDASNKKNTGESAIRLVAQTRDQMQATEIYNNGSFVPSNYFRKIIENKNIDIQINKLSFSIVRKGQAQFIVGGSSKSREGLVSFIEDLKVKAGFATVDSPVSDFAQEKNISFTLNIKVAI